eukprot:TRINITY_DN2181_c0_g1_i2.p1 TRINITY_DN2181_c0_g1~~TRINITY_DN2181_c0_g1_i2.p1  ORF type:complete len:547 (+),score=127.66 TRINITY_DN2181_c0_g1_i2:1042-2682(+)
MFWDAYKAVEKYHKHGDVFYLTVDMNSGDVTSDILSNLQMFWPALQVLIGDVEEAETLQHFNMLIADQYGFPPESYAVRKNTLLLDDPGYTLRPELLESAFALYQVTREQDLLKLGESIMSNLETYSKVACGFASLADINTKRRDDRLDSYFLSETLKYLFLLFDTAYSYACGDAAAAQAAWLLQLPFVFTTQAHVVPIDASFHAAAAAVPGDDPEFRYSCRRQDAHTPVAEQTSVLKETQPPLSEKVPALQRPADVLVREFSVGDAKLRLKLIRSEAEQRFQPLARMTAVVEQTSESTQIVEKESKLTTNDESTPAEPQLQRRALLAAPASPAAFGVPLTTDGVYAPMVFSEPLRACSDLSIDVSGKIVVAERGGCSFYEKAVYAQAAGAVAAIIFDHNTESELFTMTLDPKDMVEKGVEINIPLAFVAKGAGRALMKAQQLRGDAVRLQLGLIPTPSQGDVTKDPAVNTEAQFSGFSVELTPGSTPLTSAELNKELEKMFHAVGLKLDPKVVLRLTTQLADSQRTAPQGEHTMAEEAAPKKDEL